MKTIFALLVLCSAAGYGQSIGGAITQPSSSGGGAAIACVGTPGNTTGTYRQQCQATSGAIYACNNAAGCTVAADWIAQGGSGGAQISGTPASPQVAQWTNSTTVKGVNQGVFNVRTMYGAVPDGSTDNSTTITNAFTASNAFTVGIPTVYFDCDTGTTTCQYNYGGSGTSPINMTVATNLQCAAGVSLNYTGSAHAVEMGASGLVLNTIDEKPYTIQGCTFTGGASYTQGIYVNQYITNTYFLSNFFFQFGNRTGFNIYYAGNNWESLIQANSWLDFDGVTRNMVDGHNTAVHAVRAIGNNSECLNSSTHTACSIVAANIGVGFWIGDEWKLIGNVIQYHAPLIRLASADSANGDRPSIIGNHLEGNVNSPSPAITYGDPGGTGNVTIGCMTYSGNTLYYPAATGVPIVGPETPASSGYFLADCPFRDNDWSTPSSGTYYVNTNGGQGNIWGRNQVAGVIVTNASASPSVFDSNSRNYFETLTKQGNSSSISGLVMFGADKQSLLSGTFHNVSSTLDCADTSGSGTAQVCNTIPQYDINGSSVTPVAGDLILYKTTTTNTGDVTINVNSLGAKHLNKLGSGGLVVLSAGDLQSSVAYIPLTYNGTVWITQSSLVVPTSCTGLPTGTLWNNTGLASFCP